MVYLFGIIGFLGGFAAGLLVISRFLKDVGNRDLLANKSLRWTYGLAVWLAAALGACIGVWMYGRYYAG